MAYFIWSHVVRVELGLNNLEYSYFVNLVISEVRGSEVRALSDKGGVLTRQEYDKIVAIATEPLA